MHKDEGRLLYSRKLPVLSFQINKAPLNKKKCSDVHRWHAVRLVRNEPQDSIKIIVQDAHNLFECQLTKQSYEELCQAQSIFISYGEFAERLAQYLDKCLMHQSSVAFSGDAKFTLVINESESSEDVQTLYICEKNDFRCLVVLQLELTRMPWNVSTRYMQSETEVRSQISQLYLRQKMYLA